jgi:hypothetical protein
VWALDGRSRCHLYRDTFGVFMSVAVQYRIMVHFIPYTLQSMFRVNRRGPHTRNSPWRPPSLFSTQAGDASTRASKAKQRTCLSKKNSPGTSENKEIEIEATKAAWVATLYHSAQQQPQQQVDIGGPNHRQKAIMPTRHVGVRRAASYSPTNDEARQAISNP